ncbi:MAG: heparinase II/III family protein [Clostridiales bacterium]|nr:heparinase II/III family protein [Clostridiales bacterium]
MADIAWLMRRLKAMSIPEVAWRLSQKQIQKSEEKRFRSNKCSVVNELFDKKLEGSSLDADKMYLNLENRQYSLETSIPLLGDYDYERFKKAWSAGFQTENEWPDIFSYFLEYKQRDDIGDARTNWELNRHFQFALLAKDYYVTGDKKYLNELTMLFEDWNQKNPFLWGISWTSVMEVAIRCSNWCYTYCFLAKSNDAPEGILTQLQTGILNMTAYIESHYSRYSSANNHLIVEAYAIGQSGVLSGNRKWIELAVSILTREFSLQNYSDGINKELSLHYQSFYMEAVGLLMRILLKNGISVPESWYKWLSRLSEYLATCIGKHGEVIEFGDNDEGKILDLCGGFNHYQYVLGLMTCLLDRRYTDVSQCCENLRWLFTEDERTATGKKSRYIPKKSTCYKEGGNTILRSEDERILIGIDHAALGFGSIAAHGHADALSFQMYVDGQSAFVDPGTYLYHCDIENRNAFRRTENHNTVCVDGKDQSEMLGAFLWGKRAECELIDYTESLDCVEVKACHNGYSPVLHTRTYTFNGRDELIVSDEITAKTGIVVNFILAPDMDVALAENEAHISAENINIMMKIHCEEECNLMVVDKPYSPKYGIYEASKCISVKTVTSKLEVKIKIRRDSYEYQEPKGTDNC